MTRQTYSLDEIKGMLLDRLDSVVTTYAPEARGSHTTQGKYFTLNPGRADRKVGSFVVHMTGAKQGRWNDYATGDHGDVLDLIGLSLGTDDARAQLREARTFLGLRSDSPEDAARRKAQLAKSQQRRAQAARDEQARLARRSKRAQAIWLSGQVLLRNTPVEAYLRDRRGLDLSRLGRQPGVLRYLPDHPYYWQDDETGEVIEGKFPCMAAIVTDWRGNQVAVHRTWLAIGPDGRWDKAPVPKARLVYGNYSGAAINIWRGAGPRGGKPASLPKCPPGSHVMIAEGVEDALSTVLLLPDARVLAAISLSNLGAVKLPENVSRVTLVADLDENAAAREALNRAIAAHRAAGRDVRLFQNRWGGKDLNDALRAARPAERKEGIA